MKAIWLGLALLVWPVAAIMIFFMFGGSTGLREVVPRVAEVISQFAFPSMGLGLLIVVGGIGWEFWAIFRRRNDDA